MRFLVTVLKFNNNWKNTKTYGKSKAYNNLQFNTLECDIL